MPTAAKLLVDTPPDRLWLPGICAPAAIGAKFARPDVPVLDSVQKVPDVTVAMQQEGPSLIEAQCSQVLPPWIETDSASV
jgi:hypothetical protein